MLFTEYYLDRYFAGKEGLCDEVNQFLEEEFNKRLPKDEAILPFAERDLNKLAIWIATGGGKTFIMHVNILQFQHYLKKARKEKDFNRTILLTPNEGLSRQHEKELGLSGISGSLFEKSAGPLFTSDTHSSCPFKQGRI